MVKEKIEDIIGSLRISPYVFPLLKDCPIEKPKPSRIIEVVAREYSITKEEMMARKRHRKVVEPRQMCVYLIRNELNLSWREVSNYIGGGYDHTTMIFSYTKAKNQIETNEITQKHYKNIIELL